MRVPDARFGEEVCVRIQLKPGGGATDEGSHVFCRSQIAHYKTAHYIRLVDEFSMTITGKVKSSPCVTQTVDSFWFLEFKYEIIGLADGNVFRAILLALGQCGRQRPDSLGPILGVAGIRIDLG
jgi:hypothetical protein